MCVYLCMCVILYITHTFGCFHLLAVVILLWTLVYTYLLKSLLSLLWGIYPEVELPDHMVILCWIFEELPLRFLQQLQHFTLLPAQGFQFLHILTSTLVIFCDFDNSHSWWLRRSPGEGKGYPLQYSGLEIPWTVQSMGSYRVGHGWATFTFIDGSVVTKNPPCNAGDTGSIPGLERSTCLGAAKLVHHNYWTYVLEPTSCNKRSRRPEKWAHHYQRLATARNN